MKKVVCYVILTAVLFGTMEVALKIGGSTFDSIQLTFLRFFIGGVILLPPAVLEARRDQIHVSGGDILWLLLLGVTGISISMVLFQIGVLHCNAATAAALFCMNPICTMLLAHFFTSEKMTKTKAMAIPVAIVAAVFMIRPWDVQEGNTVYGMVIMLLAMVTFSAYTVMGKRTIGRLGTFVQTSLSFILGSLVLLIAMLIIGHPVLAHVTEQPLVVLYCGIVVTGLGYMFYFLAIRYSDATTGSIAFFIKPAIAPVLAVLILHETVYWNTIVGVILLICASVITLYDTYRHEDREIEETEEEVREGIEAE